MHTPRTRVFICVSMLAVSAAITWQALRSSTNFPSAGSSTPLLSIALATPATPAPIVLTGPADPPRVQLAPVAKKDRRWEMMNRTEAQREEAVVNSRQDRVWQKEMPEPASAAFRAWTEQFGVAKGAEKTGLVRMGVELAEARRSEFARLMKDDPERALELAVPVTVRNELPIDVLEKLEKPLDTVGDIEHLAALPGPDSDAAFEANQHFVTINGQRMRSYVTAERAAQPSRKSAVISGYLLDGKVLLRPTDGRLLEPLEVAEVSDSRPGKAICPTSKADTKVNHSESGVRRGNDVDLFCSPGHAASDLLASTESGQTIMADGVNGPATVSDKFTGMSGGSNNALASRTTGTKTIIVVRVDFSDSPSQPVTKANAETALQNISTAWDRWSDGQLTLDTANSEVTQEVFRLPRSAAEYDSASYSVWQDAMAAANTAGYGTADYTYKMVAMPPGAAGFNFGGIASVTGDWSIVKIGDAAGFGNTGIHELGHNLGLNHAMSYSVGSPNPVAEGGAYSEYGDPWDTMGSAGTSNAHSTRYKMYLGWLSAQDVPLVSASGVYRIGAHDDVDATGIRGLRLDRAGDFDYIVEYRSETTGASAGFNDNGVQLRLGAATITKNAYSALLDMTSQSVDGKNDAALAVGKTYADVPNGVYVTTQAKVAGANFDSMDVLVNLRKDVPSGFWTDSDVGSPGTQGLGTEVNGSYTLNGSGTISSTASDAFHFLSQEITGDCDLKARVTTQSNTHSHAKAGLMIRDGNGAGAKYVMIGTSPANNFRFVYRSTANANAVDGATVAMNATPNNWVRLKRVGDVFTVYTSADGNAWTQQGASVNIPMTSGASVSAGLAVSSQTTELSTAQFDNVSVLADSKLSVAGKATVSDTFDIVSQTVGDDVGDADDAAWVSSNAQLSLVNDATLNSANALHVDATAAGAAVAAGMPTQTLANVGDSVELAFDFRYTSVPGNFTGGFRFGLFDNVGEGFYAQHGIGGSQVYSLHEDYSSSGDYSFGNGSYMNELISANKATLADTAKHTASIKLKRVAAGLEIRALVDGVEITTTDANPEILAFSRIVIRNGGTSADFRVDNVVVKKTVGVVETTIVEDAFDVSAVTLNDESSDPSDIVWTPTAATLSVVSDATLGSGNTANVDATAAWARLNGTLAGTSLSQVGDAVDLAFDFRYTAAPGNVASGIRFGFFNSAGDGFCIANGTGGNNNYAILEDISADASFGAGGTTAALTSTTKTTVSDTAKHTARIKLRKVAAGLKIEGWVDGVAITTTDATPVTSAFDTLVIRNGNHTTDFRVDNVTMAFSSNSAPAWTWGSITLPAATEDSAYSGTLVGQASDPNAEETLTYEKVSGPAWLSVAANGALGGTPGNSNVGENSFTVKVTDGADATATATLKIAVDNVNDAPAFTANPINKPQAVIGASYSSSIGGSASDIDAGDALTYWKLAGPNWLNVAPNGALSGTPPGGSSGTNTFTVMVTDGSLASATATLNIPVIGVLPGSWTGTDIGSPGVAGDASESGGVYTISGSGSDVWGTADSFQFAAKTLTGDGEIRARVTSQTNTDGWAKAGVMIRETTGAGSAHGFMLISPDYGFTFQYRTSTGGDSGSVAGGVQNAIPNNWVRLTRSGTTITAYSSADGSTWTQVGTATISMASSVSVGLAVTSHNDSALSTATFDNVAVTPFPSPWKSVDIGTGQLAGKSESFGGAYTILGSGSFGGTSDRFRYIYQDLSKDGWIKVRLSAVQNTGASAKVGVMIRESLANNACFASMSVSGSITSKWDRRITSGGANTATSVSGSPGTLPNVWLKIERVGNTITASRSADGQDWTEIGTQSITLAENCYIGLCVASGSTTTTNTSVIEDVTVVP